MALNRNKEENSGIQTSKTIQMKIYTLMHVDPLSSLIALVLLRDPTDVFSPVRGCFASKPSSGDNGSPRGSEVKPRNVCGARYLGTYTL